MKVTIQNVENAGEQKSVYFKGKYISGGFYEDGSGPIEIPEADYYNDIGFFLDHLKEVKRLKEIWEKAYNELKMINFKQLRAKLKE